MKVVVLGGTGFLGTELIHNARLETLAIKEPVDLVVVSRNPPDAEILLPGGQLRQVTWIKFDLSESVCDELRLEGDLLVDCAMSSRPEDYLRIEERTHYVSQIESYASSISNFNSFVYVSSGAVYGPSSINYRSIETDVALGEKNDRINGYSTIKKNYAESKIADEKFVLDVASNRASGTKFLVARLFSVAPTFIDSERHFALSRFVGAAQRGRDINFESQGAVVRSYLMGKEFWSGLFLAQEKNKNINVVNFCSYDTVSLDTCAKAVAKRFDVEARFSEVFEEGRIVDFYVGDNSRLAKLLGPSNTNRLKFDFERWLESVSVV